jgi:hypothetical protein
MSCSNNFSEESNGNKCFYEEYEDDYGHERAEETRDKGAGAWKGRKRKNNSRGRKSRGGDNESGGDGGDRSVRSKPDLRTGDRGGLNILVCYFSFLCECRMQIFDVYLLF